MQDYLEEYERCQSESLLQPHITANPPNELIGSNYTADRVAQIRLVTKKDHRKDNIHYVPSKIASRLMKDYAQNFTTLDVIGHHYAQQIASLVYLKFNNSSCCEPISGPTIQNKLMSGLFLPLQTLYTSGLRHLQPYYKIIPGIDVVSYGKKPARSFERNSKSCAYDPKFSSNYEGGNLFAAIRKEPYEYDLVLQSDSNSDGEIGWFNFAIKFTEEGYYSFNIVNLTSNNPCFAQGLKIAYMPLYEEQRDATARGEQWCLGGENISIFENGLERENAVGKKYFTLHFEYRCKNKNESFIFSSSYSYTNLDLEQFFNQTVEKKTKLMIKLERTQIGETILGTPLYSYLISRKRGRGQTTRLKSLDLTGADTRNKKHKTVNLNSDYNRSIFSSSYEQVEKSVVFLGRQHPADIQGSYIIEGIIEHLLENLQCDSLKKMLKFYFIPNINPDGMKYGHTRTTLTGSDPESVWRCPHPLQDPEVHSLRNHLIEINRDSPISMIMNISAETHTLLSTFRADCLQENQQEDIRIFPYIFSKRNQHVNFSHCIFDKGEKRRSAYSALAELFPTAMVYEFRAGCFKGHINYESEGLIDYIQHTPDTFRSMGKQLASAYLDYAKLSDKNVVIRQKWIKEIEEIEQKKPIELLKWAAEDYQIEKSLGERFSLDYLAINKDRCNQDNAKITQQNSMKRRSLPLPLYNRLSGNSNIIGIRKAEKKRTMPPQRIDMQSNRQKQNEVRRNSQNRQQFALDSIFERLSRQSGTINRKDSLLNKNTSANDNQKVESLPKPIPVKPNINKRRSSRLKKSFLLNQTHEDVHA